MATLVSPSPKETMKAIEDRRKIVEARRKHRDNNEADDTPVVIDAESRVFKNTSFYDSIAAEEGAEAAEAIKNFFGDSGSDDSKRPVTYIPKQGQLSYFERAIAAHQKGEDILPLPSLDSQLMQLHLDSIDF